MRRSRRRRASRSIIGSLVMALTFSVFLTAPALADHEVS